MRVSLSSDMPDGIASVLASEITNRGHSVLLHGALTAEDRADWAWSASAAARDVATGHADQAIVCCWTGTGASIAANKVPGVRAALCADAYTATGARKWNDANVLALSVRATSVPLLIEILDAWFAEESSSDQTDDRANIDHVDDI
ncbi:RpiB/LacA/LacB family sugar-phosphate isomerase [Tenggerimyces flavus]|uniref:RpiB/LacA/LacB family sugar-phosphate isomerase n=1 Tax=Tenggerimyces flavus TaxID=1708749 RepID=A0ABV7YJ00_9ACTN|nr:RpiB/LacA/LacB family sugar-phosphate isomerase [Tenggerimyces flavus]MBM7784550.1 ribose 5-phosphate isomerase B [Tenggerimyces flavus]